MISGIGASGDFSLIASMRGQMVNPFEELDANGDGFLDETEIGTMADKFSEMTGQAVNASQLISKLDTDGDGQVSEEEFEAGRPEGPPPEMMGKPDGGLAVFLQQLLGGSEESEDDDSSDTEDALDTNGDGVVDAEELLAGMNWMIQEYQNRTAATLQDGGSENHLNLFA
jgi:Ca2+-binding EF-hand superfamily protein